MTPLNYIIITWAACTCAATIIDIHDIDSYNKKSGFIREHSVIFSPVFLTLLIYVIALAHNVLFWPITIWRYIALRIKRATTLILVRKILKLAGNGKEVEMKRLLNMVKKMNK